MRADNTNNDDDMDGVSNGSRGLLKSVRSPVVTGDPIGNDFPLGKLRTYTYVTNYSAPLFNLETIRDGNGRVVLRNSYYATFNNVTGSDPNFDGPTVYCPDGIIQGLYMSLEFDRIERQEIGGLPIHYSYAWISKSGSCYRWTRTVINDRMGNVRILDFDYKNRLVGERVYTGRAATTGPTRVLDGEPGTSPNAPATFTENPPASPLRPPDALGPGDPTFFHTKHAHGGTGWAERTTLPKGNASTFSFFHPGSGLTYLIDKWRVKTDLATGLSPATLVESRWYGPDGGSAWCGGDTDWPDRAPFAVLYCEADAASNRTGYHHDRRGNLRTIARHLVPRQGSSPPSPLEPNGCEDWVCESFEYDNLAPTGPGLLTAHVHPDNGSGWRQRDELEYYSEADCPTPADPRCAMRGYLKRSIVDALGERLVTTYEHDSRGNVTRIVDPLGTVTALTVNALDQVVQKVVTFDVDGQENFVSQATRFRFDANNNLVRTDVANLDLSFGSTQGHPWITTVTKHDLMNRPVAVFQEVTDVEDSFWEQVLATEDLDALLAQHGPDDRYVLTRTYHDGNGNVRRIEHGEATAGRQPTNVEVREHDERDLLFRVTLGAGGPEQSTTQTDYDLNGNVVRVREGIEQVAPGTTAPRHSTRSHDDFDRLIAETDAMGNERRHALDANGNVTKTEIYGELLDQPGAPPLARTCLGVTRVEYDRLDRPIRQHVALFDPADYVGCELCPASTPEQDPAGWATMVTTYTDRGQVESVTDPLGRVTRTTYDTAGRPRTVTDARGNVTTTTYDPNGNPTRVETVAKSDLGGPDEVTVMTARYDGLNRAIAHVDGAGHATRTWYDSRGNATMVMDELGNLTRARFDGLSRLVETRRELRSGGTGAGALLGEVVTRQTWDASSRLVEQSDDNGSTTRYEFDPLGRLKRTLLPDGTVRESWYDVHGNEIESLDANLTRLEYTWDLNDRLTRRSVLWAPSNVDTGAWTDTFEHDGLGRIVAADGRAQDGTLLPGRVTRTHDSRGNLETESVDGGPPLRHLHDAAGNPTQTTYPSGRVLSRRFDVLDRVQDEYDGALLEASCALAGSPGGPATCLYHDDFVGSRLKRRVLGNGVVRTLEHDADRLPSRDTHVNAGGVLLDRWYAYSDGHDKSAWADAVTGRDRVLGYDSLHRLTHAESSFPTLESVDYGLDGAQNREVVTGGPAPGAYVRWFPDDVMNRYSSTPVGALGYDGNGNTARWYPVPGNFEQRRDFRYDVRNVMTGWSDWLGRTALYAHDALGRRIAKAATSPGPDGTATPPTRFVFDGDRVIEEWDLSTNVLLATYTYGDRYVDDHVSMRRGGQAYFYCLDDQHTTQALTDATGAVVERYAYGDYGQPTFLTPAGVPTPAVRSAFGNPFLFTGHAHDPETGWYAMRARYCDPRLGRFTVRDPLGAWGDAGNLGNAYAYAGKNPATWRDPSGMAVAPPEIIGGADRTSAMFPTGQETMTWYFPGLESGQDDGRPAEGPEADGEGKDSVGATRQALLAAYLGVPEIAEASIAAAGDISTESADPTGTKVADMGPGEAAFRPAPPLTLAELERDYPYITYPIVGPVLSAWAKYRSTGQGSDLVMSLLGLGLVVATEGAIANTQVATASSMAARGAARTAPRNLAEKLALDEAKGGAGNRIMQGKINDPKFPEDVWAKMQHVHEHPGGTQTVIHYWENLQTGAREGFKFK